LKESEQVGTHAVAKLTLHGWFPRTTVLLHVLSENHVHALKTTLVSASAFGDMCPWQTVVIGPVIQLQRLLQVLGWAADAHGSRHHEHGAIEQPDG
jgi:hypothetical protein